MRARIIPPQRPRGTRGLLTAVLATLTLVGSLVAAAPATAAAPVAVDTVIGGGIVKTAPVVGFNPENIISDDLFYDSNAMTAAQIQSFLDSKIGTCRNGKCLNVLNAGVSSRAQVTSQTTGNVICNAIQGGTMRVSELIYRVQVACGISAKVILVTLQKEQGLVTSTAPSDWNLKAAMGASCPDTAPCDPAFAGVGPQILKGTQQIKTYKAAKFAKQPGTQFIGYSPTASCGGTTLNIRNYATAALYSYTPYQPNASALAAGFGLGNGCASYGNRNFYNYYTLWFGSTQQAVDPCKAPASGAVTAASGEFTVNTGTLNARIAPTTACDQDKLQYSQGDIVTRTGTYGDWTQVRRNGVVRWVSSTYLAATPATTYTTSRVAGDNRYTTAIAVSQKAFPNGTKAKTVYLASGLDFPDALAGAPIAVAQGGSLLLTDPRALSTEVAAELARLAPEKVVLIGGEAVMSKSIAQAVARALPASKISRVAGADRYETSRMLAKSTTSTTAYLASGAGFADALAASSVAGARKAPILLVQGSESTVDAATLASLKSSGVKQVIIVGGEGVISKSIASDLTSKGIKVTRYGGADRYATSQILNAASFTGSVPTVYLATGVDFPDALSGAVVAGRSGAPLLSQPQSCIKGESKDWLISSRSTSVVLIGGPGALSDAVLASARC